MGMLRTWVTDQTVPFKIASYRTINQLFAHWSGRELHSGLWPDSFRDNIPNTRNPIPKNPIVPKKHNSNIQESKIPSVLEKSVPVYPMPKYPEYNLNEVTSQLKYTSKSKYVLTNQTPFN